MFEGEEWACFNNRMEQGRVCQLNSSFLHFPVMGEHFLPFPIRWWFFDPRKPIGKFPTWGNNWESHCQGASAMSRFMLLLLLCYRIDWVGLSQDQCCNNANILRVSTKQNDRTEHSFTPFSYPEKLNIYVNKLKRRHPNKVQRWIGGVLLKSSWNRTHTHTHKQRPT